MTGKRSFIAVDISDVIRSRAADLMARLRTSQAKVSWVALPNMHVTLKFLGEQTDDQLVAVCRSVQAAVTALPTFRFRCEGAGAFPDVRRPRTVWIGVSLGADEFTALQGAVESGLEGLGVPQERRRFRPHVTLGRVRGGGPTTRELGALIEKQHGFQAGEALATEVLVMSSRLDRRGTQYDVLARNPLATP